MRWTPTLTVSFIDLKFWNCFSIQFLFLCFFLILSEPALVDISKSNALDGGKYEAVLLTYMKGPLSKHIPDLADPQMIAQKIVELVRMQFIYLFCKTRKPHQHRIENWILQNEFNKIIIS